jgi:DNA mismatch repair protein MutS
MMSFQSILFDKARNYSERVPTKMPFFFTDLNLDQLFTAIIAGREEYDLWPFFSMTLDDADSIAYRHETMRDLGGKELRESVETFADSMKIMRKNLVQSSKLSHDYQKASLFLEAAENYCDAVNRFAYELSSIDIRSRGFLGLREFLSSYVKSEDFRSLVRETKKVKGDLWEITYSIQIKDGRVTVSKFEGELDYSAEVEKTFQRFEEGAVKDYRVKFHDYLAMNNVEERILDQVIKLFPDAFLALRNYYDHHHGYVDPTINRFDLEVQFYLAYMEFTENLRLAGLKFCYPEVSDQSKEIYAYETFDLALANKLVRENSKVVVNDFYLKGRERIFVVSGPNQGGKTTFARTFGQLHYLAKLGYPVPGRKAKLFLCDQVLTHFEKEENLENLRGKLQDELIRVHDIFQRATNRSIMIINESFASTTLNDALFLGKEVLRRIIEQDILCVYVTFIDELSTLSEKIVSMVSTIVPENPAQRTFKITRKPADGRAYAIAIAEKYGLTYETLKRRIREQE